MTTYYKTRRIEVTISPDKRKVENLSAEFYSYDTNVAKLVLALKTEEGYILDYYNYPWHCYLRYGAATTKPN